MKSLSSEVEAGISYTSTEMQQLTSSLDAFTALLGFRPPGLQTRSYKESGSSWKPWCSGLAGIGAWSQLWQNEAEAYQSVLR